MPRIVLPTTYNYSTGYTYNETINMGRRRRERGGREEGGRKRRRGSENMARESGVGVKVYVGAQGR